MIDLIFAVSPAVRYVAIYRDQRLEMRSRDGTEGASSSETDTYEEILVNPTVLKLTQQRGNIDCGGLEYVLIRYGNFFQFVLPMSWGHVSVAIEAESDPIDIGDRVRDVIQARM